MDLGRLKLIDGGTPSFPSIRAPSNTNVKRLIQAFDIIKKTKNPRKRLHRAESLIYKITSTLRHSDQDHLYQTTSVWILINLFRLDPPSVREIMIQSGIPGILYDALHSRLLTGSTRQYASELCFYLSSDRPYPLSDQSSSSGPLPLISLPEIHKADRLSGHELNSYDSLSVASSDISESVDVKNGLSAFVPYRIDDANLKKMKDLFSVDRHDDISFSKANGIIPSRYGFSTEEMDDELSLDGSSISSEDSYSSRPGRIGRTADDIISSSVALQSNGLPFKMRDGLAMTEMKQYEYVVDSATAMSRGFSRWSSEAASHQTGELTAAVVLDASVKQKTYLNDVNRAYDAQGSVYSGDSINGLSAAFRESKFHEQPSNLFSLRPAGAIVSSIQSDNQYLSTSTVRSALTAAEPTRHFGRQEPDQHRMHQSASDGYIRYSSSAQPHRSPTRLNTTHISSGGSIASSKLRSKLMLPARSHEIGSLGEDSRLYRGDSSLSSVAVPPDMPDSLAALDPLSLNVSISLHAAFNDDTSMGRTVRPIDSDDDGLNDSDSDDDDIDDDDDWRQSTEVNGDRPVMAANDDDNTASAAQEQLQQQSPGRYGAGQKVRMRAEKLIDHRFVQRLFIAKATLADAQSFVARLGQLLGLMDHESSGFVRWEAFCQTLLALAPQHLLRADVIAFLDAQGCAPDAQIDYREFLISGKVLVLQKEAGRVLLPVTGWLSRQKSAAAGDSSTYTWRNHQKWYRKRRARAVVWLMRRATKAFKMSDGFGATLKFLHHVAAQAKAVTFLLEVGHYALVAREARAEAKRHLLRRCLHMRRYAVIRDEAATFLRQCAVEVEEVQQRTEMRVLKSQLPPKRRQADIARVFLRSHQLGSALQYLRARVPAALAVLARKDAALRSLILQGRRCRSQAQLCADTQEWLSGRATTANDYLNEQEDIWKSLIRIGTAAYRYLCRQEDGLVWLLQRSVNARAHEASKDVAWASLSKQCQTILRKLNAREDALAALRVRGKISVAHGERQEAAMVFLRRYPAAVWANEAAIAATQAWLRQRGQHALLHADVQTKALAALQYLGAKSSVVLRRSNIAYSDLQQIGEHAKLVRFERVWAADPKNAQKLREERNKLLGSDGAANKARATLGREARWRAELEDAFEWIAKLYSPMTTAEILGVADKSEGRIGRVAFARLFLDGALVGMSRAELDAAFWAVDPQCKCYVTFEDVWSWFTVAVKHQQSMSSREETSGTAKRKYPGDFTVTTILSAQTRATIGYLRRVVLTEAKQYFEANGGIAALKSSYYGNLDDLFDSEADSASTEESEDYDPTLGDEFGNDENGKLMRKLKLHDKEKMKEKAAKKLAAKFK